MPVTETETPIPFFLPLPFPRLYNETLYSSSPIRLPRISTYEVLHFNHRCSLLCPHLYLPLAIDNANFPSLSPFRSGNSSSLSAKFIPPPPASIAPDTGYAFSLFDNRSLRFRRAFSRVKKRRKKAKRKRRERKGTEEKWETNEMEGRKWGKIGVGEETSKRKHEERLPTPPVRLQIVIPSFLEICPRSEKRRTGLFVPEETRRGKRDEKAKRQLDRDAFYSRSIESMPIVTRAIVSTSVKYRVSSPYSDSNWTREGCGAWQRPSPSIGEIIDRRKYRTSLKSGRD